jgi:ribose transport system permease protein
MLGAVLSIAPAMDSASCGYELRMRIGPSSSDLHGDSGEEVPASRPGHGTEVGSRTASATLLGLSDMGVAGGLTILLRKLRTPFLAPSSALALLFVAGAFIAPSSVGTQSLNNLLYFGSILGLVALGQFLVIIVGGIDLSVAPTITLSGILFAKVVTDSGPGVFTGTVVALAASLTMGLLNGFSITVLRVTPLIATLSVGALATGVAYSEGGAGTPVAVPDSVSHFLTNRTFYGVISVPTVAWLAATFAVAWLLRFTVVGRRFVATGASAPAARALGIRVDAYRVAGYMGCAFFAGLTGIVLAAVALQPGITLGDPYLLPSIVAVIIGGAPFGGGIGSAIATGIGALFWAQLSALALSLNASYGVQLILEAVALAVAVALYNTGAVTFWLRRMLRKITVVLTRPFRPG